MVVLVVPHGVVLRVGIHTATSLSSLLVVTHDVLHVVLVVLVVLVVGLVMVVSSPFRPL